MTKPKLSLEIADFDNITAQDLRDNERLSLLYIEAVRRGFWKNNSHAALEFVCLAEKALKEDKQGTPGRLFYGLIKHKNTTKITDAMEIAAERRLGSGARQELVDRAGDVKIVKHRPKPPVPQTREEVSDLLFGRNIGFHHGVMVQCFMPQQAYDDPIWQTDHGKASLMIEAGHIPDPTRPNKFVQRAVPSGTKSRLIMPYIVGYAVQHKTPEIDMGDSLRRFIENLGMSVGGSQGKEITRQVENIAASTMTLGFWGDKEVTGDRVPIAKRISFWLEKSEEQGALWRPSMTLGTDFFEALKEHRVPVDMDHLVKLAGSARRQDLYVWLNYRLPKLRKPLPLPWEVLHNVFGQGIADPYKFRDTFKNDLKHIHAVHDGFNVEPNKKYVMLNHSRSAVPHKITRMIPK